MANPTVEEIMNRNVISVHPETSVIDAHEILSKNAFDGMPVVDGENKLVGILTEYDLIVKGSSLHLPTFQKILGTLDVYKGADNMEKDIEALKKLTVKDMMNDDPLTLPEHASFEEVVAAFRDHHRVNPIPVIDADRKVVGVVSRYDVLKPFQYINNK